MAAGPCRGNDDDDDDDDGDDDDDDDDDDNGDDWDAMMTMVVAQSFRCVHILRGWLDTLLVSAHWGQLPDPATEHVWLHNNRHHRLPSSR